MRHEEWRSFTSPVSKELDSRFGNAYYHLNLPCILIANGQTSASSSLSSVIQSCNACSQSTKTSFRIFLESFCDSNSEHYYNTKLENFLSNANGRNQFNFNGRGLKGCGLVESSPVQSTDYRLPSCLLNSKLYN